MYARILIPSGYVFVVELHDLLRNAKQYFQWTWYNGFHSKYLMCFPRFEFTAQRANIFTLKLIGPLDSYLDALLYSHYSRLLARQQSRSTYYFLVY